MKERIKKCSDIVHKQNLDAFLISNPANITYLTGFRRADGYLLLTKQGLIYFVSSLYKQEAENLGIWRVIAANGSFFSIITKELKRMRIRKVGFEAKKMHFTEYNSLQKEFNKENIESVETVDLVEGLREVKEQKEIEFIKKAVNISEEAFIFIDEIYDEVMTEKDLSIEIEKFLRLKGDNEIAFSSIVASGKNSTFPHHLPGESRLDKKIFLIDLGSKCYNYCSDLTRVFFRSRMPPLFKKIYDVVRKAKDLSIKKIKPGIKAKDVDKVAREFIESKGWGKYFIHGLGHGVGLDVHELPYINQKSERVLEEGMVVTIEPAVYLKGKFGIRIEDMVLLKHNGVEVLSGKV